MLHGKVGETEDSKGGNTVKGQQDLHIGCLDRAKKLLKMVLGVHYGMKGLSIMMKGKHIHYGSRFHFEST